METNPFQEIDTLDAIDLKRLYDLLRRSVWLLLLGLLLGGVAAFGASLFQTPIYEARTQVMVTRSSSESPVSDLTQALNSQQISQTYVELLSQEWVRDTVAARVGGEIDENRVQVSAAANTQIITITVEDPLPDRAMFIADSLVDVLIEQNESIQASRYTDAELGISQQIQQMESQISAAQAELDQANAAALAAQQVILQENIASLQAGIEALKVEIAALESQVVSDQVTLAARRAELVDKQSLLSGYERAYTDLLVTKKVDPTSEISRLEKNLSLYQQIYLNLLNNRETVRLERMQNMPNVVQLNPAIPSEEPVRPRVLLNLILGALAGLVLAVALVFLRDMLDTTLRSPEQVTRELGLPVLGFVAEMEYGKNKPDQVFVASQPRSPISEAFRTLRTNLEFVSLQEPIRTLLVTSAGPGEGKTTVAVNLAAIISQGEVRTALLDADLRRPCVHRYLGLPNRLGLSSLLRGNAKLYDIIQGKPNLPNLPVITSGTRPPNPAELLGSSRMGQILEDLKMIAEIVVIDTPPSLVADAQVLATRVDAVLFVIQPGVTHSETARASLEMFRRAGVRLAGVVMNRIDRKNVHYYGSYKFYSPYSDSEGYYSGKDGSSAIPAKNEQPGLLDGLLDLKTRISDKTHRAADPKEFGKIPSPEPYKD